MIDFEINFVAAPSLMLDVGFDAEGWERLDRWKPKDRSMLHFSVDICLGAVGMVGTNDFALEICTRPYLKMKGTHWKPEYVLVVDEFDWLAIKPMVKSRLDSCRRETWDASVAELRKHFYWEYETKQATRKKLKPLPMSVFPKLPKER